jgi:uncharacterized membrane protein (DUF485 family)
MTLTTAQQHALAALSAARWRIAILLTLAMMVLYFGFILLLAFAKPLLGRELAPGLSLGILFGTVVILASWMLIFPLSFVVGIGVACRARAVNGGQICRGRAAAAPGP